DDRAGAREQEVEAGTGARRERRAGGDIQVGAAKIDGAGGGDVADLVGRRAGQLRAERGCGGQGNVAVDVESVRAEVERAAESGRRGIQGRHGGAKGNRVLVGLRAGGGDGAAVDDGAAGAAGAEAGQRQAAAQGTIEGRLAAGVDGQ